MSPLWVHRLFRSRVLINLSNHRWIWIPCCKTGPLQTFYSLNEVLLIVRLLYNHHCFLDCSIIINRFYTTSSVNFIVPSLVRHDFQRFICCEILQLFHFSVYEARHFNQFMLLDFIVHTHNFIKYHHNVCLWHSLVGFYLYYTLLSMVHYIHLFTQTVLALILF